MRIEDISDPKIEEKSKSVIKLETKSTMLDEKQRSTSKRTEARKDNSAGTRRKTNGKTMRDTSLVAVAGGLPSFDVQII